MLGVQSVEPFPLVGAAQRGFRVFRQLLEVVGMRPPDPRRVLMFLKPVQPVLPDRLQHPKPWIAAWPLFLPEQTLLDERRHPIQRLKREIPARGAYDLRTLQCKSACEDCQAGKKLSFVRGQQVVTPVDRAVQGLLACWQVPWPSREELQAAVQPRKLRSGREKFDASRREFERQRQAIQAHTNLRDGRRIRLRDREIRLDGPRPLGKECDRIILGQCGEIGKMRRVRNR